LRLKGVNYDVGRVLEGHPTRPTYDAAVVHRELEIIRSDLHCNAVKIQGLEVGRVMAAARAWRSGWHRRCSRRTSKRRSSMR